MRLALVAPLVTPIAPDLPGGSQLLVADLAQALSERGHQVDLYAAEGSRLPGVTIPELGIDARALAETVYDFHAEERLSPVAEQTFRRVFQVIAAQGYDLVHNHAFDSPAIRAAAEAGIPALHTLHLPPSPGVATALREAQAGAAPPYTVVVSNSQTSLWGAEVRVDRVVRNGIPVARIPWSAEAGPDLLFAGRTTPEKGLPDATEIARRAGRRLRIFAVGGTPAFPGRDSEAGISAGTALPRERLWKEMGEVAAVLCPIHWPEPFGLVAAEAQACGTPVVGYRLGALEEVVSEGSTGFLVPENDLDAASAAVARIARLDRGACRRHAERHLDLRRMIDEYEILYGELSHGASF